MNRTVSSPRGIRARARLALPLLALVAVVLASPPPARPSGAPSLDALRPPQPPGKPALRERMAAARAQRLARSRRRARAATANQDAWDAVHYDIDIQADPSTSLVSGTVTMTARVRSTPVASADLDLLANMAVTACTAGGSPAAFTHAGDIVTITLDRSYAPGETFTVSVTYVGTPDPFVDAFGFDSYNGAPMIWSLSEPYGARSWWPCKDVPSDKADSVDIHIAVPDTLIAASNGVLRSTTTSGGWTTWSWHEGFPIATYLVSVAAHPYATTTDWYRYAPTDSMPIVFYNFPGHDATWLTNNLKVKDMLAAFAPEFGEYPFVTEKYGHAEFLWLGGMEHQTLTSLGGSWEWVMAHELAHQWWGDMVTCRTFNHIWLNEGFATYAEALWAEARSGSSGYFSEMLAAKYFGGGTVYVADTTNVNRIFHTGLSYNKASWVLHMLRHVVGDSTFFDCLRTYGQQYRFATATTEDFQAVCEQVSGMNLGWFFHEWIYEAYYPAYAYTWTADTPDGRTYSISLTIDQQQTNYVFKMPVDVRVTTIAGDTTFVVWDSLATQTFTLAVDAPIVDVALDPDEWILRTVGTPTAAGDATPRAFALEPNVPNPFNPTTSIAFTLPDAARASLAIYDVAGRRVRTLVSGRVSGGVHRVRWDGRDDRGQPVASGVYFARLRAGDRAATRKMVLVR